MFDGKRRSQVTLSTPEPGAEGVAAAWL